MQETAGVTWESPLWTLAHQGAPLIPRGLSADAVEHAAPLLLKLEEAGPPCLRWLLPPTGSWWALASPHQPCHAGLAETHSLALAGPPHAGGSGGQPNELVKEPREGLGKAREDGKGCHRPPWKTMHPGSERHWLTYLAELGPPVLRHPYGGQVSSCLIEIFA